MADTTTTHCYALDPFADPGRITIRTPGRMSYTAEDYDTAERFAQQLRPTEPIGLPAECDTTRAERAMQITDALLGDPLLERYRAGIIILGEFDIDRQLYAMGCTTSTT